MIKEAMETNTDLIYKVYRWRAARGVFVAQFLDIEDAEAFVTERESWSLEDRSDYYYKINTYNVVTGNRSQVR